MTAVTKRTRDLQNIWDAAQGFGGSRLPRVLVMTDPRAPEPELDLWPGPVGVIYRHFGADDRIKVAERLRLDSFAKGHKLLIGNDPELAIAVGADGVHFPRDAELWGPRFWRNAVPDWLISMAGLKEGEYLAPLACLDGLLVSSVFASESASAGEPIGVSGLRRACELGAPVYALGGVNARTVHRLAGLPIAGIAGVSFQEQDMDDLTIEVQTKGRDKRIVGRHADFPGLEAELDLKFAGEGSYAATHTLVPREMEGKGVGSKLFARMVELAREEAFRIIPTCPFIVAKFKRKPETRDVMVG